MKAWLVTLCLITLLWGLSGNVKADCAIEQLTAEAKYILPQLSGERVIWSNIETDAEDNLIAFLWLYDLDTSSEPLLVTDMLGLYQIEHIDGNLIGWASNAVSDDRSEILLYQIDTGTTLQITDNHLEERDLLMNTGQVVWTGLPRDGNFYADGDIFLYNPATGDTTRITETEETGDFSPQVYEGRVVWLSATRVHSFLRLYERGIVRVISDHIDHYSAPKMNDLWIVWTNAREDRLRDIYVYDFATRTESRIGTGNRLFNRPSLSATGVVWSAADGDDDDIFYYDGSSVRQLTSNDTDDASPSISGNFIVWEGRTEWGYHIFQYQISTDTTTQITSGSGSHHHAQTLDDGTIAWLGNSGSEGGDIFVYRCQ